MKIEELIIDGFKSYATRTVISDWDPQFNAITGLNGSGKSNILDAICFVLGIASMTTVRASSLQDLIYKRGQAGVTKASVTVVFDNSDKSNSPIGFTNSSKISVTRQVVLGGTSKYLINGHRAPQQSVLQLFQSVQLNINNPNFLIMQGKITKVLNMKPTEILSLIEEAAGTKMFEDRKDKAERTMAKKEAKLQENRSLLREEIEPKLEKLRNEKRVFIKFQEIQSELEKTERIVHAFSYDEMASKKDSFDQHLKTSSEQSEKLKDCIAKISNEIDSLNEDFRETKKAKQKEIDEQGKLSHLEKSEGELLNELSRAKAQLDICNENQNDVEMKLGQTKSTIEKNEKEYQTKLAKYKETEKTYRELNKKLGDLRNVQKGKEELLSALQTGVSSTGVADAGYNEQLSAAKQRLNDCELSVKKLTLKMDHLQREFASNVPKLQQAEKEQAEGAKHVEKSQKMCEDLQRQIANFGYDAALVNDLRKEQSDLRQQLSKLNNESSYLKRKVANVEFTYSQPHREFDPLSVKGVAARLFTLSEQNYDSATALQVCAGGRLYNIVVDNEKTASKLLERGRLRKRVTIIPLNKIAARTLDNQKLELARNLAPGKVELALNLVGYEEDVSKAMQFIFGNSLICHDAETAKKVTFHPQIRTRSITLQGDVYDPEGTLSGGSRSNTTSLLIDLQKYNAVMQQIQEMETRLKSCSDKLDAQEAAFRKTKALQNELSLAHHKLKMAQRDLEGNDAAQIIKRNRELQKEIEDCKIEINSKTSSVREYESEVLAIQNDIEEFSHDKGSKLAQLKQESKSLHGKIESLSEEVETVYDAYQSLQLDTEQLSTEISSAHEAIRELTQMREKLEAQKRSIDVQMNSAQNSLNSIRADLKEEQRRLLHINEELNELDTIIKNKIETRRTFELELQKLTNDLNRYNNNSSSIHEKLSDLLRDHDWLKDKGLVAGIIQQNCGINLEQTRERLAYLQEQFQELKRKVNPNIMSMIENLEKKESSLKAMISTIEKDKIKIQETIAKLNEYKKDTLIKTWNKVTVDFGNIFADLLPNSFAKLVPIEGKEVTEGLEVKVKLGNVWKESLIELSGGQRSLVALSLIMALLQFRPAPMYILDEVDAALDLSHTQNIGHLIKTRFKGSQFIVVSLKEGMFTNANRVFRTRFQDGTSVVGLM
ncbi:hypothetical protein HG536_0C04350 [Torulaspora globosa]|uniref:Structural maintenance of chromosomes protein n=1 Tax=Torulaspora globosa TaxID=48254 RepID=A0A7G3ZFI0_9SACH|nr:uncharacterized protein HG536_0C04350 [Torulaspora globosa]QLL32266.1 hypothetical protein HG536_0C04350 [Torulaspora globosa]